MTGADEIPAGARTTGRSPGTGEFSHHTIAHHIVLLIKLILLQYLIALLAVYLPAFNAILELAE